MQKYPVIHDNKVTFAIIFDHKCQIAENLCNVLKIRVINAEHSHNLPQAVLVTNTGLEPVTPTMSR